MFQKSDYLKIMNVILIVLAFILSSVLWIFKMAISSDIPVSVDWNEFINFLLIGYIYFIFNLVIVKIIKTEKVFLFIHKIVIVCSVIIWTATLINEIYGQYHYLSTSSALVGFAVNLFIFILQLITSSKRK